MEYFVYILSNKQIVFNQLCDLFIGFCVDYSSHSLDIFLNKAW